MTANTRGALMNALASMIKKSAKNPRELKKLVRELDGKVKAYKAKTGQAPDEALVSSIVTAIMDEDTKRILMQMKKDGDYSETQILFVDMARRINESWWIRCHGYWSCGRQE